MDRNAQSVHEGHFYLAILLNWAKHPMMHPEGQWVFRNLVDIFFPYAQNKPSSFYFVMKSRGQPHHAILRVIPTQRFPNAQRLTDTHCNTQRLGFRLKDNERSDEAYMRSPLEGLITNDRLLTCGHCMLFYFTIFWAHPNEQIALSTNLRDIHL